VSHLVSLTSFLVTTTTLRRYPSLCASLLMSIASPSRVQRQLARHGCSLFLSGRSTTPFLQILLNQSASTVKRLCLELGGNAPLIVFPSASVDQAVQVSTSITLSLDIQIHLSSGHYCFEVPVLWADLRLRQPLLHSRQHTRSVCGEIERGHVKAEMREWNG